MEAPDIILVKIKMANVPSSSPKVCSAETPNNHTRDGCAPQTLTHKASAESCCDPKNLYLSTLLEIPRTAPRMRAAAEPRMRPASTAFEAAAQRRFLFQSRN